MHRPNGSLLTFLASILTLVMAISITSAAPISASGELTRPVTVANTTANPIPSRDVENPLRSFVSFGPCQLSFPGLSASGTCYTAPAGTRALIQDISFECFVLSGERVVEALDELGGGSQAWFDVHDLGNGTAGEYLVGGRPVSLYLSAGNSVFMVFQKTTTTAFGSCNVFGSGYTIPYP